MEDYILIPISEFCKGHHLDAELVQIFSEQGLIEIVERDKSFFIPENQVKKLEQIIVFHKDLDINLEGIEAIFALLQRMETMQAQIIQLENKLQRFS
jgi:hypothetical protein